MKHLTRVIQVIITLFVLAVLHSVYAAEVNTRDLDCLAKNIFYEASNESEEGMVAVGLVTINRSNDGKFPPSICGVVNQRIVVNTSRTVAVIKKIKAGFFGRTKTVTEYEIVNDSKTICQFSWKCNIMHSIRRDDERWRNSLRIARTLLTGGFDEYRDKYSTAMYFHAVRIQPIWSARLHRVGRVGGHIFYADADASHYVLTLAKE